MRRLIAYFSVLAVTTFVGCATPLVAPISVGPATPLAAPTVTKWLSTLSCERGERQGSLTWAPVAGAHHYEVTLVGADSCCDYKFADWPETRWSAGRTVLLQQSSLPRAAVDSIYYRVRAVSATGARGLPAFGMWGCRYEF